MFITGAGAVVVNPADSGTTWKFYGNHICSGDRLHACIGTSFMHTLDVDPYREKNLTQEWFLELLN